MFLLEGDEEIMIKKLEPFVQKYNELSDLMCSPKIIEDPSQYRQIAKQHAGLAEFVELYDRYSAVLQQIALADEVLRETDDPELVAMAESEKAEAESKIEGLDSEVRVLLLPKDASDESNVYIEVRPAAGGDEASLFGAELFSMYRKYAEKKGWATEIIEYSATEVGGLKEGVMRVDGVGVYRALKWESGVHRVQRVPETESQGRVHTSTVTVAILPEVEEVNFEIDEKDLRIDTYRSGGHGGQGVNTTDSAIRITHLPTGLVVACQDERSQIKNKDRAMSVLRAKLQDMYTQKAISENAQQRKMQVGTGDRSERIRTYNFPQGRVTDHRIGLSLHNIYEFMQGDIDEMLSALHEEEIRLKLENL